MVWTTPSPLGSADHRKCTVHDCHVDDAGEGRFFVGIVAAKGYWSDPTMAAEVCCWVALSMAKVSISNLGSALYVPAQIWWMIRRVLSILKIEDDNLIPGCGGKSAVWISGAIPLKFETTDGN